MNRLDVEILRALRQSSVHLPAPDLASQIGSSLSITKSRLVELRAAGFEIEDRPGYGFRLLGVPDRLVADDLLARLGPSTLVREVLVFQETDSTNEFAMRLGKQGASPGLAIFAERQTAGRGRLGRRWDSASHKGLWFSLLLRPAISFTLWPRLTTWAAVVLSSVIDETIPIRTAIKWPNDVYADGRKVAGILAEIGTDPAGVAFAVLGIGVNVNHESPDFPRDLAGKAGSLRGVVGKVLDRSALAVRLLEALDLALPQLGGCFESVIQEARCRSPLLGHCIQVRTGDSTIDGVAEDLDENGHLLFRTERGELLRLTAGEVTVIPP